MILALMFATPLAALGLAGAGALALLYRFRKRATRKDVPSLLLWPHPVALTVATKSRDRFRFPPSFFLELAILLCLVLAALTPLVFLRTDALLYVIRDVSPSMQAVAADGTTAAARAERILAEARASRDRGSVAVRDAATPERLAAELAKARSADVLVLTDRPPSGDLPDGVRWRSVGASRANRAITAAVRTAEAVHLEVSTFVPGASNEVRRLTLPCAASATNVVVTLDALGLALPDDALAADDRVVLPPPFRPSPTVALAVTNAALAKVLRQAVAATGFAVPGSPETADVVLADHPLAELPQRPHVLRFLPAAEKAAVAGPFWTDPGERLFDGVTFDGQAFPAADWTGVEGQPVAFGTGAAPVPLAVRGERTLTLGFAQATLPFFRTPSFPALVVNFLTAAARERASETELARAPEGVLSSVESDLTRNRSGDWGVAADAARVTAASPALVWALALVAAAGLVVWGRLFRRRTAYALAALTALALMRPYWTRHEPGGTLVVLADRSLSLGDGQLRTEELALKALAAARPADAQLAVVDFAAAARVVQAPGTTDFAGFDAGGDRTASDAEAAFAVASGLVPEGARARYLVLSDGLFTAPPEVTAATPPVDVLALARPLSNDLAVVRVAAPSDVAPGATVPVSVWVRSDAEVTVPWTFGVGTNVLATGTKTFRRGLTPVALRDRAPQLGASRRYRFALGVPAGDPVPENNAAQFLVRTSARKPVLVVTARPDSALPGFLTAAGVPAEGVDPGAFDAALATLTGYAGVILENQPTARLGGADFRRLTDWVTRLGGGFAMTGGEQTFGPGGWHGSPVEDILPVTLERRMDKRKYALSLAIVMDRSGSMAMPAEDGGRTKMDMANLGAASAIDMLAPGDFVSVIAVDSTPHVILKMQDVTAAQRHMDDVLGIVSEGGGIYVEQGLLAGLRELEKTGTPLKHLVLFADAADSEEPGDYERLLSKAADAGVTVSVIGLGSPTDCDADLLKKVAVAGRGDCYFENDAREIPRIFMQDTFLAAKMLMVTNPTPLTVTAALGPLTDARPSGAEPPVAGGYNLLYAREGASVAVATADEEAAPFVAYGPAGLGRTAVLAGEVEGAHAAPLMATRFGRELVAAVGRYVAGAGVQPLHDFVCDVRLERGGMRVTAVPETEGAAVRSNDGLVVRVLRDGGGTNEVRRLAWVAEDVLEAFVPIRGGETVVGVVECPDGGREVLPPVCLMYPAEYLPCADPGEGERALRRLAERTGGRVVASVSGLWSELAGRPVRRELAPAAYLLAGALFLVLVARRLRGPVAAEPAPASHGNVEERRISSENSGMAEETRNNAVVARHSALQRAKRRAGV